LIAAGASLIALLHDLANHGSDRLLISHRHRRDHRSELGPGRVRDLDAWIKKQNDADLSRPEAIRRLVELGLKAKGK
jgi:uncharacterized protein (DUF58 family)